MAALQAIRKLNNNAVLCIDGQGHEVVALGKGLGYGELPRPIALAEIERTFYNVDLNGQNVMKDLPAEVVLLAARIIEIAQNELSYELSPNAVLLLADHLAFAMDRNKKNIRIEMPLAYDVRQMYPVEYRVGQYTVARVRKELGVRLSREEAVGIAMNLINAKAAPSDRARQEDAARFDQMLEDITEIVENELRIIVDRDSFSYARYATHLRYLFQRIAQKKTIESDNLRIYGDLQAEYPKIGRCVDLISDYIARTWHTRLSEEERLYLILHVNRICVKEGL